jgi:hypothetical protein
MELHEAEHRKYLRKKERLAEKTASMSEEQKLELLEKRHLAIKRNEEKRKAELKAYDELVKEGKVEKIEKNAFFGYKESNRVAAEEKKEEEEKI